MTVKRYWAKKAPPRYPPQEPQQEGQEQEPQAQEQPTQDNNAVDEAANVAQAAAQAAAQREQDYQRIMAENEQLRQTNNELQQTITQQSQQREQAIIEDAMQMPMLDVNRLAFEDDATVQQMQQDYANAMQKYVTQQVLKTLNLPCNTQRTVCVRKKKGKCLRRSKVLMN